MGGREWTVMVGVRMDPKGYHIFECLVTIKWYSLKGLEGLGNLVL